MYVFTLGLFLLHEIYVFEQQGHVPTSNRGCSISLRSDMSSTCVSMLPYNCLSNHARDRTTLLGWIGPKPARSFKRAQPGQTGMHGTQR